MAEIIAIFGGTGFLGRKLISELRGKYVINIAARNNPDNYSGFVNDNVNLVCIDDTAESYKKVIDGAAAVVNLSGASIAGKRWSDKYRQIIYNSRINTTRNIVAAMKLCEHKPAAFISTSAVGYYGNRYDEVLFEESEPGNDFLSKLCINWENEALQADKLNVRTVCIRIGFVLDKNEGGLKELLTPFRFFAGGTLGNGKQYMSWIHHEDVTGIQIHALMNNSVSGCINAAAPNPVTNTEFSKTLAKILHRPCMFRIPGFVLKLIIGEFSEFLLTGQRVLPGKTETTGYKFKYNFINDALSEILK